MLEIREQNAVSADRVPEPLNRERHRQRLANLRAVNREYLRAYGRTWKLQHPDRIKIHRENEYAERRRKRRRLRLRREAQRRRRALQRLRLTNPSVGPDIGRWE